MNEQVPSEGVGEFHPDRRGGLSGELRRRSRRSARQPCGINTAFIEATSSNAGTGFAIPVKLAHTVIDQIVEAGEIRRGSLGITLDDATPDVVRELKTARGGAVVVKFEPRSSGARAGLKPGDTVTEVWV
jgi:S1-C subfamily serine protease